MPHITLVSGYLLPFFELNIWGVLPTSIIVLVAINQPFTLWMLHSFFLSIPKDLDESAMVDGCSRFQAFRRVDHPGDVAGRDHHGALQLPARLQRLRGHRDAAQRRTTRPWCRRSRASSARSRSEGNVMYAVAAVVSATVPLFILVLFFQRQIVSGLTAGAVKG